MKGDVKEGKRAGRHDEQQWHLQKLSQEEGVRYKDSPEGRLQPLAYLNSQSYTSHLVEDTLGFLGWAPRSGSAMLLVKNLVNNFDF